MSLEATFLRVAELQSALAPPAVARATGGGVAAPASPAPFNAVLGSYAPAAMTTAAAPAAAGGTGAGRAALAFAQAEVGQAEQPPGSNDSPRIAQYRQATAGSGVGPWCAYFVSWAAREAGTPVGDAGQGYGRVDDVWAWAERSGKALQPGAGPPQPGDLIVWDEHIGIVEAVRPDGSIQTVEGNSSDQVSRRVHGPDGDNAVGYVRLG